jgi:hypothetical protein
VSVAPRATLWVAAAAVLSLVSPGAWGAWQGTGARNGSLASAQLGYSLSGAAVTGGGTGYSWVVALGLLGSATDHLSVANTGSVAETIKATVAVSGVNLGSPMTLYGCPVPFTGSITCASRVTIGSVSAGSQSVLTLATNLAAGTTYYLAASLSTVLALTVTTSMAANSFTITPRTGIDRTSG